MRYSITYFDKLAFRKTEEERTKILELTNIDTLSEAVSLLQNNKYIILSVTLFDEKEIEEEFK